MNPNSEGEKQTDSEWEEVYEDEPVEEADGDEPAEEADEDEPVEEADGDEPVEEADGDEPVEEADEDEPVEEADGDEPVEEADGDEPAREADEDEPAEVVYEDEPVEEADGDEPAQEADGDEPVEEAEGGEPVEEADEDEPVEEADEDESAEEADGDEPVEEADGDEPVEEADGDEPAEEADGDEPAEEADEDEPVEEGDGEDSEEGAYEDNSEEEVYEDVDEIADDDDTEAIYAAIEEDENTVDLFRLAAEAEEENMVDLFDVAKDRMSCLPEQQNHGAFYYWCKRKTAAGWVSFGAKCLGAVLLLVCLFAVLYFNGLLDLIDYRAADDFEQYYNLSDTDYHADNADVYSNPTNYNESTTIDGFDPSMIDIPKEDVVNILLIGTDVRNGTYEDRGNTDSMILLSVNTRDKNIKLTSFMRDMYVDIPGREWQRLNAAYAYGGPQLLFDTLERNFDVDVDQYVRVNFANFRKIIDKVGGVNIELTEAEARYMNKYSQKYKTKPVEPGMQRLDGAQALSYARCRKIDSDFNRTGRQRKVILAAVNEIRHCNVMELNSLLNTILPMIQTNMSKRQILNLMADSVNYLNNDIETLNIPIKNSWQSATIRKMSVICPNFALNKTAILAHVYSTYRLDVDGTRYQNFDVPGSEKTTRTTQTTQTTQTFLPTENQSTSAPAKTTETAATSTTSVPTEQTQETQGTETAAPTETTAPTQTEKTTADAGTQQEPMENDEAVS